MDLKQVAIWAILIVGGTLYFGWWYFVIMGVFLVILLLVRWLKPN